MICVLGMCLGGKDKGTTIRKQRVNQLIFCSICCEPVFGVREGLRHGTTMRWRVGGTLLVDLHVLVGIRTRGWTSHIGWAGHTAEPDPRLQKQAYCVDTIALNIRAYGRAYQPNTQDTTTVGTCDTNPTMLLELRECSRTPGSWQKLECLEEKAVISKPRLNCN